ncbi:hypothetical protein J7L81_03410, partial [Candidatus Aerophobetes bacterium]|nr:hypothetical protein [Candidatus Aerophobetes bacterium]
MKPVYGDKWLQVGGTPAEKLLERLVDKRANLPPAGFKGRVFTDEETFECLVDTGEKWISAPWATIPATYLIYIEPGVGYVVRNGKTGKIEYIEPDPNHAEKAIQWAIDSVSSGKIFISKGVYI